MSIKSRNSIYIQMRIYALRERLVSISQEEEEIEDS